MSWSGNTRCTQLAPFSILNSWLLVLKCEISVHLIHSHSSLFHLFSLIISCCCFAKIFVSFFSHSHLIPFFFLFLYSNKLESQQLQESDFKHYLISYRLLRVYCLIKCRLDQFSYEIYSCSKIITMVFQMYYCFQRFFSVIRRSFYKGFCY